MAKTKQYSRLSCLEAKAARQVKTESVHLVYIAALTHETDLEAIQKRLGVSSREQYNIDVLRRDGDNITITSYDQKLELSRDPWRIFHPSNENAIKLLLEQFSGTPERQFTMEDLKALYYLFHWELEKIDNPNSLYYRG